MALDVPLRFTFSRLAPTLGAGEQVPLDGPVLCCFDDYLPVVSFQGAEFFEEKLSAHFMAWLLDHGQCLLLLLLLALILLIAHYLI